MTLAGNLPLNSYLDMNFRTYGVDPLQPLINNLASIQPLKAGVSGHVEIDVTFSVVDV
jgi:hypothetical protein